MANAMRLCVRYGERVNVFCKRLAQTAVSLVLTCCFAV
jgi:hypothetical protein